MFNRWPTYLIVFAILTCPVAIYYERMRGQVQLPADRDAQRIEDMHSLGDALSKYYGDKVSYPAQPASVNCQSTRNNVPGLADALVPKYIKNIPQDTGQPNCQYNYWYWSDTKNYVVLMHMETINPIDYSDHWCIGTYGGTVPTDIFHYHPCPQD